MLTDIQLMNALERRFVCIKCHHTRVKISDLVQPFLTFARDNGQLIRTTCRHCGHTEFFDKWILQSHTHIDSILDEIYGARVTTKLVPPPDD